ncbi:MAG TPA: alpha/beta hydrolase [Gammaproteobacteria bacterium]
MPSISSTEDRIVTARGRLFVKRWMPPGAAGRAPVVLFHDSLGTVELWRDFPGQLALATAREIIAYDRAGFGQSDPRPGALGMNFIRDEASGSFSDLCEQLALERFVAFGHSVGGAMAVACAAAFPGRCQALVTESAQAFVEDRTLDGIRDARQAFAPPGQLERLEKYHGGKAAWVLAAWIDTWLSEDFRNWSLDEDLCGLRCPILAIHGDRDEYGSLRHLERIAALAGGPVVTKTLPDCGHVPYRERQRAVTHAVKAFLAQQGL